MVLWFSHSKLRASESNGRIAPDVCWFTNRKGTVAHRRRRSQSNLIEHASTSIAGSTAIGLFQPLESRRYPESSFSSRLAGPSGVCNGLPRIACTALDRK